MALGERLGCASEYTATVHWRGGQRVYAYLGAVESLEWGRERRKTSRAKVTAAVNSLDESCLMALGRIWPWSHEITLYRDGHPVWQGPMREPVFTPSRVVIDAADVSLHLEHRMLLRGRKLVDEDLSEIGRAVVESAFAVRDPNVVRHVVALPSGRSATRTLSAYSRYASDELSEVAGQGVDWTCVGRTVFFNAPADEDTAPQGRFTSFDFVGEVEVALSGEDYASRVYAAPQAQDGAWNHVEAVGGASPYFGLVERVVQTSIPWQVDENGNYVKGDQPDALDEDEAAAALRRAARARHTQVSRPPIVLRCPQGARLSPDAPVSVDRLVPGAAFQLVLGEGFPWPVARLMRLTSVAVSWGSDGEQVKVSLVQIGSSGENEVEEP